MAGGRRDGQCGNSRVQQLELERFTGFRGARGNEHPLGIRYECREQLHDGECEHVFELAGRRIE
ncbi:MAG: hypothetical protein FWD17_13250 [Polyangiaceae bacterium]|nr:hypothetical protein [Polyangiaceae bacterium]